MISNSSFLLLLIGCMLVTLIPRVLPFLIVRNFTLSKPIEKWLSYLPICIFTGLVMESLIIEGNGGLTIDWTVLAASIPTIVVGLWTKSLLTTVVFGVVCMAIIRFFI